MASWKQSVTTFPSSRSSMRISVSTLPFCGLATSQLEHLPPDIGIELLCECGNDYFWDSQMEVCMRHRSGPLTVHAPFLHMNLASPDLPDACVVQNFTWAFQLAARHHARYLVVHPGGKVLPGTDTALARQVSFRRLELLSHLSARFRVPVCIENLGSSIPSQILYPLEEYLMLFQQFPCFFALLDIGHAHLAGWDIPQVIAALRERLLACHLHDNHGITDEHGVVGSGSIDWAPIASATKAETPDAILVLEYEGITMDDLLDNIPVIRTLFSLSH